MRVFAVLWGPEKCSASIKIFKDNMEARSFIQEIMTINFGDWKRHNPTDYPHTFISAWESGYYWIDYHKVEVE